MIFKFDENTNTFLYGEELPKECNEFYADAFLRYLNYFYELFDKAFKVSEFSALLTIFGVKGIEDPGWDTYKSTIQIINSITIYNDNIKDFATQRNLHLWTYGHIMEASEPYEKIKNLLDIITGEQYSILKFPPNKKGIHQSPGQKINKIVQQAKSLGFNKIEEIYNEIWNRDLRNSIFHSDYSLFGEQVRIRKPTKIYEGQDINKIVNYAYAYFSVLDYLQNMFIKKYEEPTIIKPHPDFKTFDSEKSVVIVREDHGAIGLKDNWTLEQLSRGKIPYRIGRFYPNEIELLNSDPLLAMLPKIKY